MKIPKHIWVGAALCNGVIAVFEQFWEHDQPAVIFGLACMILCSLGARYGATGK